MTVAHLAVTRALLVAGRLSAHVPSFNVTQQEP